MFNPSSSTITITTPSSTIYTSTVVTTESSTSSNLIGSYSGNVLFRPVTSSNLVRPLLSSNVTRTSFNNPLEVANSIPSVRMGPPYPSGIRNIVPYRPPPIQFLPGPSRPMGYRNRLFNPG